jgi:hypothetical protein
MAQALPPPLASDRLADLFRNRHRKEADGNLLLTPWGKAMPCTVFDAAWNDTEVKRARTRAKADQAAEDARAAATLAMDARTMPERGLPLHPFHLAGSHSCTAGWPGWRKRPGKRRTRSRARFSQSP